MARTPIGAGWHYDAAASGRKRTAWGNNWVVVGVLVRLPFVPYRMVCLPVLARLWQPAASATASSTWPASSSG
jgi:hypothetical protein